MSQVLADSAEAVIHADATKLPEIQPGDGFYRFPVACLVDSPRNVRQPASLDIPRNVELTNTAPLAVDLLVSSKEVQEDHTEQFSPPEITPSHLREIDHV